MKGVTQGSTRRASVGVLGVLAAVAAACGGNEPYGPNTTPYLRRGGAIVRTLLIDGKLFPGEQFHLSGPDRCDGSHWHKNSPALSIGTVGPADGAPGAVNSAVCPEGNRFDSMPDPDPGGCGFGKTSERPLMNTWVANDCWEAWRSAQGAP